MNARTRQRLRTAYAALQGCETRALQLQTALDSVSAAMTGASAAMTGAIPAEHLGAELAMATGAARRALHNVQRSMDLVEGIARALDRPEPT